MQKEDRAVKKEVIGLLSLLATEAAGSIAMVKGHI